jgi:two-component system chemotaxis response regulator CheB
MTIAAGHSPVASAQDPVRVLLVDDSGVVRAFLKRFIESDPGLKVTGTAANGQRALDALNSAQYDIVVLDIEMPLMDGLTALPLILKNDPAMQVIVASTLTKENAVMTMKCLEAGAIECLAKPTAQELAASDGFRRNLVEKVKTLGLVTRRKRSGGAMPRRAATPAPAVAPSHAPVPHAPPAHVAPHVAPVQALAPVPAEQPAHALKTFALRKDMGVRIRPDVVAIGSSTGGPQALLRFFADLKRPLKQPIFITQHMPPTFTTILAEHITKNTGLPCREAAHGEEIKDGSIYLAPGDHHMTIKLDGTRRVIALNQDPPVNFCRPAVDPMLLSLMEVYGPRKILAVIMTGMGSDGSKACKALSAAGGAVIAQDEESSVVWGMPGVVAMAGICSSVLPIGELANEVRLYADRMGGAG